MPKKSIIALFFLAIVLLLSGCETDLEINSDWEDITVVYALLSQNDSISYIKINKAFLGDEDALVMAQEPDSSLYYDDIEVKVDALKEDVVQKTFVFDTTRVYDKEEGVFYYPEQFLYKCTTYDQLDEEMTYRLNIRNKKTSKLIYAETELVKDFFILKPQLNHPTRPSISIPDNETSKEVSWLSAEYGKRYQLSLCFHYKEKWFDNPDTLRKEVEWLLGSVKSDGIAGGEEISKSFSNQGFYAFLENKIIMDSPDEEKVDLRVAGKLDIIISVAGSDFNTYMEVNEPTATIVQTRPEYTNIENGIGLFSSRYSKTRTFSLNPATEETLASKENLKFRRLVNP